MLFSRFISLILTHRVAATICVGLLTVAGSIQTLRGLKVDNSLSIWFLEDNPDYREYLDFQKEQGSDEIIIAMIPSEDALEKESLATLDALHQQLDSLPFVRATFSLAKATYPVYRRQQIVFRDICQPNRSRNGTETLLNQLPSLKSQLLTDDGKYTFFYIQLSPTHLIESNRKEFVEELVDLLEASGKNTHISGPPILNEAYNDTIYEESIFFAVVSVAVILILLFFLLPNLAYLPLALLSVVVPVSISLGIMTGLGYSLNLISMLIPTVLMVYSISDVIHIVNIFHIHRLNHPYQSRHEQIKEALQKSLKPCFYTTLTTIVGYLALYLSPLPAFKVMGLFTFIGLCIAFFLAYVITTIGFSYMPEKPIMGRIKRINIDVFVATVQRWTTHRQPILIGMGILIMVLGIFSMSKIEVNTDALNLLGDGKAKDDLHLIEEKLEGSARLQLNIISQGGESLLEDRTLERLSEFQEKLSDNSLLAHPISILNFQQFLEKRTPLASLRTTSFESIISNSDFPSDEFFSLFSEDYSQLAININIKELETRDLEKLLESIEAEFESIFPSEDYRLKIHGFSALYAQLNQFILQTQLRSFGAAFLIAFCILFYFIGNLKHSFLALIPNILPLFLALILMAVLGIHLEAANAMLAPIMLGIAMDDTIHLMNKFIVNQKAGHSITESMDQALSYTGGALFATSISLVCGFLVVGMSGVASVSTFGLLCAFTIVAALLADVVILPALMKRLG